MISKLYAPKFPSTLNVHMCRRIIFFERLATSFGDQEKGLLHWIDHHVKLLYLINLLSGMFFSTASNLLKLSKKLNFDTGNTKGVL